MISYIVDLVQTVLKPSIAALAISLGIAIIAFDSGTSRQNTVDLSALGCEGLLKIPCDIVASIL